jgi:hypothetical protein
MHGARKNHPRCSVSACVCARDAMAMIKNNDNTSDMETFHFTLCAALVFMFMLICIELIHCMNERTNE